MLLTVENWPRPVDAERARLGLERLRERAEQSAEPEIQDFVRRLTEDVNGLAMLEAVFGHSPHLTECMLADLGFLKRLIEDGADACLSAVLEEIETYLYPLLATKRTDMPVVPEGAKQSTLNINSIHGGEAEQDVDFTGFPAPCVADRCRIIIDRRFLIEEDLNEVKAEVHRMLETIRAERPNFEYEIRDMHEVIPTMTDKDAPVVTSTAAAIEKVLGQQPSYVVSPGTYDQKHIDRIGRLKNCIAYGPGILDLAHQPDEWVGVEDMVDSAGVMALVLKELL